MTVSLGEFLQKVREKMGFSSARAFYLDLSQRIELGFNYSYYMKIETGRLIPSQKVISQLAALLDQTEGDRLVEIYCRSLFPQQMTRLIKESKIISSGSPALPSVQPKVFQQVLTEKQVNQIAETMDHYFLFLVLTLARRGLARKELTQYGFKNLGRAIADLEKVKLIYQKKNQEEYFPSFPEYVFPSADSRSIKDLYAKMDQYDFKRNEFFSLEKLKRASFFKRISPRQTEIILAHLELLFQTIRSAEETDATYNTEVMSLSLSVFHGQIVG
ncbi:helix-turn-helix domain-containing protein [bacterium]|nr:helix-turn-helix domain-containing protein [bacterium]